MATRPDVGVDNLRGERPHRSYMPWTCAKQGLSRMIEVTSRTARESSFWSCRRGRPAFRVPIFYQSL